MQRLLATSLTLFLTCVLPAQGGSDQDHGARERIVKEMVEKRRLMREGRVVRTNVHVTVRLHNGNRFSGVLKNGRFIEQIDGLEFIESDVVSQGSGLRVWYYNNTISYIFLPFTEIRSYKIGARLTDTQVKAMEEKMESDRKEQDRRRQDYVGKRTSESQSDEAAKKTGDKLQDLVEERKQRAQQLEEEARLLKLLDEFPPKEGWGEAKLSEINQRKVAVGAFPDAKSQRFIEVFKDWQKAFELQQQKDQKEQQEQKGGKGEKAEEGGGKGDTKEKETKESKETKEGEAKPGSEHG